MTGTLSLKADGLGPVQTTVTNSNSANLAAADGTDDFAAPGEGGRGPAIYRNASAQLTLRTKSQVAAFFDGLELIEPGIVPPHRWRPVDGAAQASDADVSMYAGVARKPR